MAQMDSNRLVIGPETRVINIPNMGWYIFHKFELISAPNRENAVEKARKLAKGEEVVRGGSTPHAVPMGKDVGDWQHISTGMAATMLGLQIIHKGGCINVEE